MANDQNVRRQIARKLETLATILSTANIVRDIAPLYNAAADCQNTSTVGKWRYSIERLIFHNLGNLDPFPSYVEEMVLELSVDVEGFCELQRNSDPFTSLEFNILVEGKQLVEADGNRVQIKKLFCAWHLDRDEPEPTDSPQEFLHPRYHFQFGGHYLKRTISDFSKDGDNSGYILITGSPRLPHPPMEGILGIDFVLTNFVSSAKLAFREQGEYYNLVQPMQEKIWKPYMEALASMWQPSSSHSWSPFRIWPQLMPPKK